MHIFLFSVRNIVTIREKIYIVFVKGNDDIGNTFVVNIIILVYIRTLDAKIFCRQSAMRSFCRFVRYGILTFGTFDKCHFNTPKISLRRFCFQSIPVFSNGLEYHHRYVLMWMQFQIPERFS